MARRTARSRKDTQNGWLETIIIPAVLAIIPAIRSRRGKGVFSVPYLLLMGALLLLQRYLSQKHDR